MIEGYTHSQARNSALTSGDSVPLASQVLLICRVVGLAYGTPLNYTWTCPSGPCEVEGYHGRKVYKEHILAITTSPRDGGTYTCQVTAAEEQNTGMFEFGIQSNTHGSNSGTLSKSERSRMSSGHCMYIHVCVHNHLLRNSR